MIHELFNLDRSRLDSSVELHVNAIREDDVDNTLVNESTPC